MRIWIPHLTEPILASFEPQAELVESYDPSDGAESFFIVPEVNAVPGPIAGAGWPGLLLLGGLIGWRRLRARALP